jgi:hypothetical protein
MVDLYLHSPICLRGAGTTLPRTFASMRLLHGSVISHPSLGHVLAKTGPNDPFCSHNMFPDVCPFFVLTETRGVPTYFPPTCDPVAAHRRR